ncbi:hypothetical protein J27TS7_32730 [Paenibacillus dendritiformis]|nr:hypothetical protein J27TS7_32730 [Paenibacillus dendritiformis]
MLLLWHTNRRSPGTTGILPQPFPDKRPRKPSRGSKKAPLIGALTLSIT